MIPSNEAKKSDPVNIPVVRLVAGQRSQRSCQELGVCMNPVRSCTGTCSQVVMQQLALLKQQAHPFGVEGPFRRDRRARRAQRRTSRLSLALWAVVVVAVAVSPAALVMARSLGYLS